MRWHQYEPIHYRCGKQSPNHKIATTHTHLDTEAENSGPLGQEVEGRLQLKDVLEVVHPAEHVEPQPSPGREKGMGITSALRGTQLLIRQKKTAKFWKHLLGILVVNKRPACNKVTGHRL